MDISTPILVNLEFDVEKEDDRNWAYINFLQTKDLIFVPKLGIDEDGQAFDQISSAFPEYANRNRFDQTDVSILVKEDGAFNCVSW